VRETSQLDLSQMSSMREGSCLWFAPPCDQSIYAAMSTESNHRAETDSRHRQRDVVVGIREEEVMKGSVTEQEGDQCRAKEPTPLPSICSRVDASMNVPSFQSLLLRTDSYSTKTCDEENPRHDEMENRGELTLIEWVKREFIWMTQEKLQL
jgi:hypothetical protein